jgi:hypothetical protein
MGLFRLFRKKTDIIPKCTFYTPRFKFRVDNASHQNGYHIHLYIFNNSQLSLTNIVFTRIDKKVYAYIHSEGKATIILKLSQVKKRKFIKTLNKEGLLREIMKNKAWTTEFSKNRIYLFEI